MIKKSSKPTKKPTKKKSKRNGRPPLYFTDAQLRKKIDQYFVDGMRTKTMYTKDGQAFEMPMITISDLVLYLGFCDRQSFYDLGKQPKFSCTIKRARTFIEREYEEMLRNGNCTGAIFALKNFGWRDKQEIATGDLNDEEFRNKFFGVE